MARERRQQAAEAPDAPDPGNGPLIAGIQLVRALRSQGKSAAEIAHALGITPTDEEEAKKVHHRGVRYHGGGEPRAGDGDSMQPTAKIPLVSLLMPSALITRPISWRIEGLLPDGMLSILHARDKTGKTLLAWEMAKAVLNGEPLFGVFPATAGRVVLALLDDPPNLTAQRRDALGLTERQDLRLVTPPEADLTDPLAFMVEFTLACQAFSPQLIIIDALYHFCPTGRNALNDTARMRGIMAAFNRLAETLPAAVLLIAHDRKDGEDLAGAFAIRAAAKALLHFSRPRGSDDDEDDGRRVLSVVSKMTGEARHLLRCQGVGSWTYIGRAESARQARRTWAQERIWTWLIEGGEGTAQEVARALKLRREDALSALVVLEEEGKVCSDMRPSGGGRHRRVYALAPGALPLSLVIGNDPKDPKRGKNGNKSLDALKPAKIKA